MTRLVSCEVFGLAGRAGPVEINFDPDINIIFGLNGSGKTSLLRLLVSAVRDDPSLLQRVPFEYASVTFHSAAEDRILVRSISQADLQNAKKREYFIESPTGMQRVDARPEGTWQTKPRKDTRRFHIAYLSTNRLLQTPSRMPRRYGSDAGTERDVDEAFAQQVDELWTRYSNRLLSEVRQIQERGLAHVLRSVFNSGSNLAQDQVLDVDRAFERVSHFLGRQSIKVPNSKSFRSMLDIDPAVRSAVEIIDTVEREMEAAEEPRRQLEGHVAQFFTADKRVIFGDAGLKVNVGDREIDLAGLSSGEKQLLRILVETVDAGATAVVVDEPELSMHIDWQRELVEAMRTVNRDAQLILATHSPEVMANAPDSQIIQLWPSD